MVVNDVLWKRPSQPTALVSTGRNLRHNLISRDAIRERDLSIAGMYIHRWV